MTTTKERYDRAMNRIALEDRGIIGLQEKQQIFGTTWPREVFVEMYEALKDVHVEQENWSYSEGDEAMFQIKIRIKVVLAKADALLGEGE